MDVREFVAEELWFAIGVLTLPAMALAGLAGFETIAGIIVIMGWFFLCPLFLFWGEQLADVLVGESEQETESATDPLTELKGRYARGEIDDEEFERRVDRLLAVDDEDVVLERD